jgi:hypothetical protein
MCGTLEEVPLLMRLAGHDSCEQQQHKGVGARRVSAWTTRPSARRPPGQLQRAWSTWPRSLCRARGPARCDGVQTNVVDQAQTLGRTGGIERWSVLRRSSSHSSSVKARLTGSNN